MFPPGGQDWFSSPSIVCSSASSLFRCSATTRPPAHNIRPPNLFAINKRRRIKLFCSNAFCSTFLFIVPFSCPKHPQYETNKKMRIKLFRADAFHPKSSKFCSSDYPAHNIPDQTKSFLINKKRRIKIFHVFVQNKFYSTKFVGQIIQPITSGRQIHLHSRGKQGK